MSRIRCLALMSAAGALVGASRTAGADHSIAAVGDVTTGYTDNVQLAPANPQPLPGDPLVPSVASDAFANIAPGLVFAHDDRRISGVLTYTLGIRLYARARGADSYNNSLSYIGQVPLSPLSDLDLSADASQGRLNAFDLAPAQNTTLDTRPRGDIAYAKAGAGVGYNKTITRSWRMREGANATVFQPTDDTTVVRTRYMVDDTLSFTKAWNYDALTGSVRGAYSSLARGVDYMNNPVPAQRTYIVGPELRWVRDLSEDISWDSSGGVIMTIDARDPSRKMLLPTGSAYLRYVHARYGAAAGYRYSIATNLLVGETDATHVVEARGTVPVPARLVLGERVSNSGAVGFATGRTLDLTDERLVGRHRNWVVDDALSWRTTDEVTMSLRYQFIHQVRDLPLLDIMGETTTRHMILVTVEGRYPSNEEVQLLQRNDGRVDGGQLDEKLEAEREHDRIEQ